MRIEPGRLPEVPGLRVRSSVLVVGESIVDQILESGDLVEVVGGSPANVARGLARSDVPVRFHTALGKDDRGQLVERALREDGVKLDSRVFSAERTSTALVDAHGPDVSYTFELDFRGGSVELGDEDIVHFGSLFAFSEDGARVLFELLSALPQGTIVTFDPNVRAALMGAHSQAVLRFEQYCEQSDVVKLSDEDAQWLYPKLDGVAVLHRIAELGPSLVALTRGSAGATLLAAGTTWDQPGVAVHRVVDTVGAGDTFMAAILVLLAAHGKQLLNDGGAALQRIGNYSVQAAALTVQRRGADMPVLSDPLIF